MNKKVITILSSIVLLGAAGVGGYWAYDKYFGDDSTSSSSSSSSTDSTIEVSSDASEIDWSALPTTEVTLSSETLTITEAGTYVLSGTGTGGVVINAADVNVRLTLNGATISSTDGPAIYVENAKNTVINLADGTTNSASDTSNYSNVDIDGAIFSSDDLIFTGGGMLNVTAKFADGISSSDDLTIHSGTINVTAADDGIRGKDSVYILGGTITVNATGDGIKSTNDTDADTGVLYIKDGTVTVTSGDDALKGEQRAVIDGGTIKVEKSVEGLESINVTINGGTLDIYATDDGINASSDTSNDIYIKITGGDVTVEVGSGDTDGIDSNGDIFVTGGTVKVTNPGIGSGPATAFDYNGTAEFTGGTIYINGEQVSEIPAESMGGGGMQR